MWPELMMEGLKALLEKTFQPFLSNFKSDFDGGNSKVGGGGAEAEIKQSSASAGASGCLAELGKK